MNRKPQELDLPVKLFRTEQAWETWLAKNGASSRGIWMRIAKKAAKLKSVTYQEALEVALCHGWIDGLKKTCDDESWVQRFTPRARRSVWSKINRDKVLTLIAAGRMKPAGMATVESARSDGRWDAAYDSYRTATVPPDLQRELDRRPKAKAFFATLSAPQRYAVLWRIQTAKKQETRAKRIREYVAMLVEGRKPG